MTDVQINSSILTVRENIAQFYRERLPHLQVDTHGGAFTVEDIKRFAKTRKPTMIVAALAIPAIERQGADVIADTTFAIFCMSTLSDMIDRHKLSLLLVQQAAVDLFGNFWDSSAYKSPTQASGENLYGTSLDSMGISLWALRWQQMIKLDQNAAQELDDFLTMHTTYDIGQTDDTVDTVDIVQVPTT